MYNATTTPPAVGQDTVVATTIWLHQAQESLAANPGTVLRVTMVQLRVTYTVVRPAAVVVPTPEVVVPCTAPVTPVTVTPLAITPTTCIHETILDGPGGTHELLRCTDCNTYYQRQELLHGRCCMCIEAEAHDRAELVILTIAIAVKDIGFGVMTVRSLRCLVTRACPGLGMADFDAALLTAADRNLVSLTNDRDDLQSHGDEAVVEDGHRYTLVMAR